MLKELKEKSELANFILMDETIPYFKNKQIISSFFKDDAISQEIIEKQLTLIDAYYSTNLAKRYYGIEEIAASIKKISNTKKNLKDIFIDYTKNFDENLNENLFYKEYGYNKKGKKTSKAFSVISKYAYFVTDYNFPIFDSIVRDIYYLIMKEKLSENDVGKFVQSMNFLLKSSGIENFNKLDNLLWLIGKINRGNYSLILSKNKYIKLVEKINIKSEKVDKEIKEYIFNNPREVLDVFDENMIEMIEFTKRIITEK